MPPMPGWTELLARNGSYAENKHQPQPFVGDPSLSLPSTFIFTCIDPRASAEQFLDLRPEEAFIVRNLGGRVKSNLVSLVFVEEFTQGQALKDVVIIHHTDCGCTHNTEESLHNSLIAKLPQLTDQINQFEFGTYDGSDLDKHRETIRQDIAFLKSSPLIRQELKDNVHGYVYDIKTGKLIPVADIAVPYDS